MCELCVIAKNVDCQNGISVKPVCLVFTTPLALIRLTRLLTFCDAVCTGSWENASVTKVTRSTFTPVKVLPLFWVDSL